ncbi:MAG: gluconate 2-dehydrogenase subunit 3 family protein [Acidobacteriota bacterium]
MTHARLNRRDAIRRLAAGGMGAAASVLWVDALSALARVQAEHVHPAAAAAQRAATWSPRVLKPHQLETVATMSERIIPQTDTPGAKAALVDRFIDSVLREATPADRKSFLDGLAWTDTRSKALFGKTFVAATPAQQIELLTRLAPKEGVSGESAAGVAFFQAIKSMTITGYYSTEVGLQQELGDDGRLVLATFEGCTHPDHQA